jgi:glycosyltransferase involved in cell wall biosynthesis
MQSVDETSPDLLGCRDAAITPPGPTVDLVVPVHNEAHVLEASIRHLHAYLSAGFPFSWRITIVDNASDDTTFEVGTRVAAAVRGVRVLHLGGKGRGLALRTAWEASDAPVLAYTDVDLSTGLDALLPLVAPLVSGHSDVAIGSRLAPGANVARRPARETISRCYNLILRVVFSTRVTDSQCGFKAIRSDIARRILPEIADDGWFFDSELLVLAEHNGLRIHEVPVDWRDDPDSRVHLFRTAIEDLKGVSRLARRLATGRGDLQLGTRGLYRDDLGRSYVWFGIVGSVSTVASLMVFLALRGVIGSVGAVVVALAITTVANSWAHRRWSFGRRGRAGLAAHAVASAAVAVAGIVASVGALLGVEAAGGGLLAELASLALVWTAVTVVRFALLSLRGRP